MNDTTCALFTIRSNSFVMFFRAVIVVVVVFQSHRHTVPVILICWWIWNDEEMHNVPNQTKDINKKEQAQNDEITRIVC